MRRVCAAFGGVGAGVLMFQLLRTQPIVAVVLIAGVLLVGLVVFVTVGVRREREFNRVAAAAFRPVMTDGAAPAVRVEGVSR